MLKLPHLALVAAVALGAAALRPAPLEAVVPPMPPAGIVPRAPQVLTDQQEFLGRVRRFATLERQMGELALQKSDRDAVQSYARRMVDAQSRRLQELDNLAQNARIALPPVKDPDPELLARLAARNGTDFDRSYINASISGHEATLAALQNQSGAPASEALAPLVKWAARHIAPLNQELGRAQDIASRLGPPPAPLSDEP